MAEEFKVSGLVRDESGNVAGVQVQVFDKDLRSERLLGEATTYTGGISKNKVRERLIDDYYLVYFTRHQKVRSHG